MKVNIYRIPVTVGGRDIAGNWATNKLLFAAIGASADDALDTVKIRMAATWQAVYDTAITIEYGTPVNEHDVMNITEMLPLPRVMRQ